MEEKNYSFNLLNDEAVKVDLFTDKTHERIAQTLCQVISNDNSDGVTIGLEGSWGSGKSTVISILREKIRNDKIKYFYFDAWAHEGDPLRRIFLESLIEQLNANNKLDIIKEEISNRKKTTTSKSKRYATRLGKYLSLAALFVPFGAGVISGIDYSNLTLNFKYPTHIPFIFGTVFCFMPILVLLINFLRCLKSKNRPIFKPDNWAFLESESNNTITQEISEDEERSSIEFERYFRQIITEVLHNESNSTRLLMVVDNLDRIDSNDSLKIWSTLQTFLQQRNPIDSEINLYKKIWIIVPYDQQGLAKLWQMDNHNNCAYSFFEKCFQLRLDVPKPVLTGWENFARAKINEALETWPQKEKDEILSVLINTRDNLADVPTPRQIKTYVNQVGLLRTQATTDIPTQSIAYYVVFKYINESICTDKIRVDILNKELPRKNDNIFLHPDCVMHLAGLVFGVNPTKGQQLLLEPVIESALKSGSGEQIKNIVKKHHKGFWIVFKYHITRITDNKVMLSYLKTIYDGLWEENKERCTFIINRLEKLFLSFPSKDTIDFYIPLIKMMVESNISVEKKCEGIIKSVIDNFNKEYIDIP